MGAPQKLSLWLSRKYHENRTAITVHRDIYTFNFSS
jgi:hypothetical protein